MLEKAATLPSMVTIPIPSIRATDATRNDVGVPRDVVASVEDRLIPGPAGEIRIRIYRPDMESGRPVTVFFHGGGFVICSIESHDAMCRQLCRRSGSIVVSVNYRLAPEHRFPAAPDDCLAATRWVAAHAAEFGGDATRLAVAGDSAGGNLATVTALRLRDEGGPALRAQLLIYPVTDHYSDERPSYRERGEACGLTREGMIWFWDHYADAQAAAHPHASPIRAESLRGLPPAYVVTGGYDLLRDEGDDYARRLKQHGVPVTLQRYDSMNHGFFYWVGYIDVASEAMDAACAWLRETL
jgi:acetyl esterase